ncbi:MAG: hypothetical protein MZW92_64890 [Comamonadaceae bacterium]|nr:hypothetical protein [Comamonadaceae bacterium]
MGRLLGACVARMGCARFGSRVGGTAGQSSLGIAGPLAQRSPTSVRGGAISSCTCTTGSGADAAAARRDGDAGQHAICEAGVDSADQRYDDAIPIPIHHPHTSTPWARGACCAAGAAALLEEP